MTTFASLLLFEVYRSVKLASLYKFARQVELERVEDSMTARRASGYRRKSSFTSRLRRRSTITTAAALAGGISDGVTTTADSASSDPIRRRSSAYRALAAAQRLLGQSTMTLARGAGVVADDSDAGGTM